MWSKLRSNFRGVAPRKGMWGIQDSLGFFIPRRGFRMSDTEFQSLSVELGFQSQGFWIPQAKNFPFLKRRIHSLTQLN